MKIKISKKLILLIPIILVSLFLNYSCKEKKQDTYILPPEFANENTAWADTTLKYLSLEEKISQLIIYDAGAINKNNKDSIILNLNKFMPGGIIYKTDSLQNFINFQNNFQKISKINLFTLQNLHLQFADNEQYPSINNLLAVKNDSIKKNI